MIDRDFSFIRLRDNMSDAFNMSESKAIDLEYVGQIHLKPNETILQISNSPTGITFNSNYDVFIIDSCGVDIVEVTERVFISQFIDSNGIQQIKWEWVNDYESYGMPIALRFTNTVNQDTWYTNLFVSSSDDLRYTTRFDYRSKDYHDGTQYDRADATQSIRLRCFYNNKENQSERAEYHQISTNVTVSARNINKTKYRYICQDFNEFTLDRLESLLTSDEVYVDDIRSFSSDALEFTPREADSNVSENEFLLSRDYTQLFTFEYQIYEGIQILRTLPSGLYTLSSLQNEGDYKCEFNSEITIGTGTLRVYNADGNVLINTYTEADAFLDDDLTLAFGGVLTDITTNGSYYVQFDAGLVIALGIPFGGINDTTTWTFEVTNGDYDSNDYDSNDYFTD